MSQEIGKDGEKENRHDPPTVLNAMTLKKKNAVEEDLEGYWGKNSVPCVLWQAASFSNNGHKISSNTQNERWMATSGRSICDNCIFRKYSQKYAGKPLKFGRKSPGKTFVSLLATLIWNLC